MITSDIRNRNQLKETGILTYETLGITVTKLKVIYVTMMENKLTENKYYHDLFSL